VKNIRAALDVLVYRAASTADVLGDVASYIYITNVLNRRDE
jgi:hypothetical protein